MSEHVWVIENIAPYLAGGLEGEEAERLEKHTANCTACAEVLEESRDLDHRLEDLFADARPGPGLEDRLIQGLRTPARARRKPWHPLVKKIAISVAALVLVAFVGLMMNQVVGDSRMPFGKKRSVVTNFLKQLKIFDNTRSMSSSKDEKQVDSPRGSYDNDGSITNGTQNQSWFSVNALDDSRWRKGTVDESIPKSGSQQGWGDTSYSFNAQVFSEMGRSGAVSVDGSMPRLSDKSERFSGLTDGTSSTILSFQDSEKAASFGFYPPKGLQDNMALGMPPIKSNEVDNKSGGAAHDVDGLKSPPQWDATPRVISESADEANGKSKDVSGFGKEVNKDNLARRQVPKYETPYSYTSNQPAPPTPTSGSGASGISYAPPAKPIASTGTKMTGSDNSKPQTADKEEKDGDKRSGFGSGGGEGKGQGRGEGKGDEKGEKKPGEEKKPSEGKDDLGKKQSEPGEPKPDPAPVVPAPAIQRKIIRSGDVEYEIDSFDSAVATITRLAGDPKRRGFVATVNSDKLPNGKVRGSVVVRVPPESLDDLLLEMRKELGKAGELKSQKIGSKEVTKEYYDLESRLKAARAMEERLLDIIKKGKGEIKDLLLAEKELGVWRTRIEEFEGELRYLSNLVSLSTLTITLYEKEIRAAYAIAETEHIRMNLEVEDVEKAQQQALTSITAAKGRITKAEMKQQSAGQYSAVIDFDVAAEGANALRDQLKKLGEVTVLDIDRLRKAEGGSNPPQDVKVERRDVQFSVTLRNVATVPPRETINLTLAAADVDAAYQKILAQAKKVMGRVVLSNLAQQRTNQTTGTIQVEIKTPEADAFLQTLKEAGDVLKIQSNENPDTANVTKSKRGFVISLLSLAQVEPRERHDLELAAKDVPTAFRAVQDAVVKAKGRIINATLNEQDRQNITAELDFDVRRVEESTIDAALKAGGDVFARKVTRSPDSDNVIDSKVRLVVKMVNAARLLPRETYTFVMEVSDVEKSADTLSAFVAEAKGRTAEAKIDKEKDGKVTAALAYYVNMGGAPILVEKVKGIGTVRVQRITRNPQVPDTDLAPARIEIILTNREMLVGEEGLWPQIRAGLKTSFTALSYSLMIIIIGLLAVLPWVLVIYAVIRLVTWRRRKTGTETPQGA